MPEAFLRLEDNLILFTPLISADEFETHIFKSIMLEKYSQRGCGFNYKAVGHRTHLARLTQTTH
jgi:hypothetical protein